MLIGHIIISSVIYNYTSFEPKYIRFTKMAITQSVFGPYHTNFGHIVISQASSIRVGIINQVSGEWTINQVSGEYLLTRSQPYK